MISLLSDGQDLINAYSEGVTATIGAISSFDLLLARYPDSVHVAQISMTVFLNLISLRLAVQFISRLAYGSALTMSLQRYVDGQPTRGRRQQF